MALSETSICNMALARIGAKRINNVETDATLEAQLCREHYDQTRDALLRSHEWRFAAGRAELSATTTPDFEWDYAFLLPSDYLRLIYLYDTTASYSLEGQHLLTNDSEASIKYVRRIEDPAQFDPMFADALILSLAIRLVMPLSQDKVLRRELQLEFRDVLGRARLMNHIETYGTGRDDLNTWNDERYSGTPTDTE